MVVFLLSVEEKAAPEKVFTDTLRFLNFLKDGYLVISVCYSCKLCKLQGLTAPVETGGCVSWQLGQAQITAFAWPLEMWNICLSVCAF